MSSSEVIETDKLLLSESDEVDFDALRQGSPVEIKRLLRRMWAPLLINAEVIVGDSHLAEDVVQEALIRALANLSKFELRGPGTLDAWLRRIVINQAISTVRTVKRRREDTLETLEVFNSELDRGVRLPKESVLTTRSTEDLVADGQTRALVMDAIRALPDSLRLPLYLRDIEGFNTKETAELLEMTEANIRTRLHRARQTLKKRLEKVLGETQ